MDEISAMRTWLSRTYSMIYTRRGHVASGQFRDMSLSFGVSGKWGSGWPIILSEQLSFIFHDTIARLTTGKARLRAERGLEPNIRGDVGGVIISSSL